MYQVMWPLHSNWMNVAAMALVGFAIVMRASSWKDKWKRFNIPWSWAALALVGGYLFFIGHNAWLYVQNEMNAPLRHELSLREFELAQAAVTNNIAQLLEEEVEFKNPEKLFDFNFHGAATLREVMISSLDIYVQDDAEPSDELERIQERLYEIPWTYAYIEGWWEECYLDIGFLILLVLAYWVFKEDEGDETEHVELEASEDV